MSMLNIIALLIAVCIIGSVVFTTWRMGGRTWRIVWAWAESTLRPVVFPAQVIPVQRLHGRCKAAVLRSVPQTAGGHSNLPEAVSVLISLDDEERIEEIKSDFTEELTDDVVETAVRRRWGVPARFTLEVFGDSAVLDGRPTVYRRRPARSAGGARSTKHTVTRTRLAPTQRQGAAMREASYPSGGQSTTSRYIHCELIALDGDGHDVQLSDRTDSVSIGRNGCTLQLRCELVSERHAELIFDRGACALVDLDSTNGTWVNGRRITAATPLLHNDEVSFAAGGPRFVFSRLAKEDV
jgi:hypothetical protein